VIVNVMSDILIKNMGISACYDVFCCYFFKMPPL
jgi:hypothetical protein